MLLSFCPLTMACGGGWPLLVLVCKWCCYSFRVQSGSVLPQYLDTFVLKFRGLLQHPRHVTSFWRYNDVILHHLAAGIGHPCENHMKHESREISFINNNHTTIYPVVVKFCTEEQKFMSWTNEILQDLSLRRVSEGCVILLQPEWIWGTVYILQYHS